MEIWKDIEGYEGSYQISNMGNVKSLSKKWISGNNNIIRNHGDILLKQSNNARGYRHVILSKNSKHRTLTIHQLMARAFIPNPENKLFVNHKDGNKKNNILENLEWCTNDENMKHAVKMNLIKKKISQEIRDKIKTLYTSGMRITDIARILGLNRKSIYVYKN